MARDITRLKNISYLNGDFESFKKDLLKFSDAHASGVITDRSVPSTTMALLELTAYIGDVLSFKIDQAFNELRPDTARQLENVVAFAKSRGYRPTGKAPARGRAALLVEVPSTVNSTGQIVPDESYSPVAPAGSRLGSRSGVPFETLEDVDFAMSGSREVTGSFYGANGLPTHFVMRKFVDIIAGETKVETFIVSEFRRFRSIELGDADVIEILSVEDSDGNEWLEVEHLAQDWVIDSLTNEGDDSEDVPYVLRVTSAPRRFVREWNPTTKKTSLTFGSGDGVNFDDELIPNIADYAIPLYGRRTNPSAAIDPRNFLKTRSLGLSPYNTTLTVTYRVGGGPEGNVDPRTIDTVIDVSLSFPGASLDAQKKGDVENSIQCLNLEKTEGGKAEESIQEIKLNAAAHFAAQDRIVTREDVIARVLSLPAKFGKPAKVYVKRDSLSPFSVDVHVLAYDSEGHLSLASPTLKRNIANYVKKYRMLTDGYNILDGAIINFGVNFGVVTAPKFNKSEVLSRCIDTLSTYFDVGNAQIGRPIVRSDVISQLQEIEGVVSVYELVFRDLFGEIESRSYSSKRFDFRAFTKSGIIYCPEDSIFELKFPRRDIIGTAK